MVTRDEIADFISETTHTDPGRENIIRVASTLAAAGWPLAVNALGEAGEFCEGVEGVGPDAHRVGIRRGLGAAERAADAGLSRAGVRKPRVGAGGFQELAHGHLRPLGGPQRVAQVLAKEPPAEPPGASGETAVIQGPDESVDRVTRRHIGVGGWHG